jgi:hypothetical protein
MTFANVVIYLALIVYILAGKVRGKSIETPKKLLALPVIVTVIGYGDLAHGSMTSLEIAVTVTGAAVSLGLGMLRGRADKLSVRDGMPFVQWGAASLILFVGNLGAKLAIDLIGVAAGASTAAAGKSLLFSFGLTLLGEAFVLWYRSQAGGLLSSPRPAAPSRRFS